MKATSQPQTIARLAAALADETRVRILGALIEQPAAVSDLAARLALTQPRASTHLAVLRDAGLVTAEANGRQRTYTADARAAAVLAALDGRVPASAQARRELTRDTPLRQARTCYDHLAGVIGVALLDGSLERRWLESVPGPRPIYRLTTAGTSAFAERGVDLERARTARRALATGCLDWTERRPHLGGALGAEVLHALRAAAVLERQPGTREVTVTQPVSMWLDD